MKNLFLFFILFLFSCSVSKKNQRAVNRVKADINLLNDVGSAWAKLNPCYPDTIHIGKVVTVIDSGYAQENIDRLNKTIAQILENYPAEQNVDSIKNAIRKEVEKECKPYVIYHVRVDTLPRDKRYEDDLKMQIQTRDITIGSLHGQITQLEKEKSEFKSASNKKVWWMAGEGIFILALITLLLRNLFKPKIT